eukprot:11282468-Heterocapsa_arctica.AAC.1
MVGTESAPMFFLGLSMALPSACAHSVRFSLQGRLEGCDDRGGFWLFLHKSSRPVSSMGTRPVAADL